MPTTDTPVRTPSVPCAHCGQPATGLLVLLHGGQLLAHPSYVVIREDVPQAFCADHMYGAEERWKRAMTDGTSGDIVAAGVLWLRPAAQP